jgi:XTP/dITP diphosphohydrolase
MREFTDKELVLATHNKGKISEITALLSPYVRVIHNAASLNLEEPEETGMTFHENAKLKASYAALMSSKPALADDSGVAVHALGGEPGIYSARWAGPEKDFGKAMEMIHTKLGDSKDRSASFICVLALAWPDGHVEMFEGRIDGNLIWPPRGKHGFGYDPMFIPHGHDLTFAEMNQEYKQSLSHRAKAFQKLVRSCLKPL